MSGKNYLYATQARVDVGAARNPKSPLYIANLSRQAAWNATLTENRDQSSGPALRPRSLKVLLEQISSASSMMRG